MTMVNFTYLLLGVLMGVLAMLFWFWHIAKTIKREEEQDDWWKKGEPPPY